MFCRCHWRPYAWRGFSLVEIMVVIVIIGLMAGVVTLSVRNYLHKAQQATARHEIATICKALETFYGEFGHYPSDEEGLEALTKPNEKFSEPLLKGLALDPWGRPYQYNLSAGNGWAFEVICFGADGREGGEGVNADIISWQLKQAK